MAPGFKTGGRVKGSRNKAVLAREAAMAEAAKLLSASDGDKFDGNAHKLLEAIYKNPVFPISLRNDAAKAALRVESPADDSIQPYVASCHRQSQTLKNGSGAIWKSYRMPVQKIGHGQSVSPKQPSRPRRTERLKERHGWTTTIQN